jgi:predicted nucleic acid-binding protein
MADALFDTTVFIDYSRGDAAAGRLVDPVLIGTTTASYSPVTVFELWVGISRDEELVFRALMALMEEAVFDAEMASQAAEWLRLLPLPMQENLIRDAFIAATAKLREEPVYTRNVRDFARFYANVQSY